MRFETTLVALFFVSGLGVVAAEERLETADIVAQQYSAMDTLAPGDDPSPDAQNCLLGLCWKPTAFAVRCERAIDSETGDVLVRFPSPTPVGDPINDSVAMEWYVAKDKNGHPVTAPAVVIVHESGSRMTIGRLFARGLRQRGLHAFMVQLPYYGERRLNRPKPPEAVLTSFQQGIADTRRARDAVAALPLVDRSNISLQGTSLGGFISATTAGLDKAYDNVFIMLAGGDVYAVLQNGERAAARARVRLEHAGLDDDAIRSLADAVEPNRLAHRLNPSTTWLFSAIQDTVVPIKNAKAFATAARLDQRHHVRMYANHYSGVLYLPVILDQLETLITTPKPAPAP